jgi:phage-related holin
MTKISSRKGLVLVGSVIKVFVAVLGAGLTSFYAVPNASLLATTLLILVFSVIIQSLENFKACRQYITQFLIYILLIGAVYSVISNFPSADATMTLAFVLWFVIVVEAAYIVVAAKNMGVPIPAQLVNVLTSLNMLPAPLQLALTDLEQTAIGKALLASIATTPAVQTVTTTTTATPAPVVTAPAIEITSAPVVSDTVVASAPVVAVPAPVITDTVMPSAPVTPSLDPGIQAAIAQAVTAALNTVTPTS